MVRIKILGAALAAGLALGGGMPASAEGPAELVMVERAGCAYCAKWVRDVAPIYPRTAEGQRAPLRTVSLDHGQPSGAAQPVRYTPTFLLMQDGREIGRITGYVDDAMFWGMLAKLSERLAPAPAAAEE